MKMISYIPTVERTCDEQLKRELLSIGTEPILAQVLASRDREALGDYTGANKVFLSWKMLKGIDESVRLLTEAICTKQKIVIVADYDSDGATSCAIALRCLRSFGALVDFVVPNRFIHGYGLTPSVVKVVYEQKAPELIMTVDNGISSFDGIDLAHKLGIKVLVTDHHLPGAKAPSADAIVNPNQHGCNFPSKSLAGCGVVFYVMAALREHLKTNHLLPDGAILMQSVLDFVAIGTIADVVRLDENNRSLAQKGLERIRQGKAHPGVAALFMVARRSMERASSKDIGFSIGPRINAAGRLDDMGIGIKCLIEDEFESALELALQLDDLNSSRKNIETKMQEEAGDYLQNGALPSAICIYEKSFHEGVIGIVAGRIKEKDHRPTIVFGPSTVEGLLKGSGRSIEGFNLKDALDLLSKRYPEVLTDFDGNMKFGGHAMAAGLTIREEMFEQFRKFFNEIASELLTEEMLARRLLTDGDLLGTDITLSTAQCLNYQVWGQGFSEPVFESEFIVKEQRLIKDLHLKLTLEKDGIEFSAMWFFNPKLLSSRRIEAVYTFEPSEYKGDVFVMLQIKQAKECKEDGFFMN